MNYNPFTGKWQTAQSLCSFTNEPLAPLTMKNIGAISAMSEVVKPAAVPIKPAVISTGFKAAEKKSGAAEATKMMSKLKLGRN